MVQERGWAPLGLQSNSETAGGLWTAVWQWLPESRLAELGVGAVTAAPWCPQHTPAHASPRSLAHLPACPVITSPVLGGKGALSFSPPSPWLVLSHLSHCSCLSNCCLFSFLPSLMAISPKPKCIGSFFPFIKHYCRLASMLLMERAAWIPYIIRLEEYSLSLGGRQYTELVKNTGSEIWLELDLHLSSDMLRNAASIPFPHFPFPHPLNGYNSICLELSTGIKEVIVLNALYTVIGTESASNKKQVLLIITIPVAHIGLVSSLWLC